MTMERNNNTLQKKRKTTPCEENEAIRRWMNSQQRAELARSWAYFAGIAGKYSGPPEIASVDEWPLLISLRLSATFPPKHLV